MKVFVTVLLAFFVTSIALDADARRLGGGRNVGTQREMVAPQPAKAPQQQAAPAQQQAAPGGAPAQPATTGSKWLGPLAGLAMGAGLAALFLNNGVAGLLAGLAMIGLILAAAAYAARMMRTRMGGGAPATAPAGHVGTLHGLGGAGMPSAAPVAATPPSDFDAAEFVRHARRNFVQLQAVHDKGDLATLRDFVTPEVFNDIAAQLDRSDSRQQTEVVTLTADVIGVATEGSRHVVSVRFAGFIREAPQEEAAPFSEVWHLEKPVDGNSGWLVAGIQQDEPSAQVQHA